MGKAAKEYPVRGRSALSSGALTGASLAILSLSAAGGAALLSHEVAKGPQTDGFFAAYGVYLVLVLVASAFRFVVLPALTRAEERGELAAQLVRSAVAFSVLAVPALVAALVFPHALAAAITGREAARAEAARALLWLLPAAVAQLYAGLVASALAARNSYATAALGFAAGGVSAFVLFALLVRSHGATALAWGLALNGAISLGVPLVRLLSLGSLGRVAGWATGLAGEAVELARGIALPVAAQALVVIGGRFASGIGSGAQTTFSYAYIIAGISVTVSAGALSLVSSAPLTRGRVDRERAVAHVGAASWLSLAVVGFSTGLVALVGSRIAGVALGGSFSGASGVELAHVVVALTPWAVASVAFSVAYPLAFVFGRTGWLPALGLAVAGLAVPLEWGARDVRGLVGLAVGLAVSMMALLLGVLALIVGVELLRVLRELAAASLVVGALTTVAFGLPSLVLGAWPAALVGSALYLAVLLLATPPPLRRALAYVHALR
ncbi:MAG: hypothetical protein QOE29_1609 [Gaiellaceae bacterium]|nr:hypothetical protein [Gaiellaceae bacterium]